jgi:hypothetical protein
MPISHIADTEPTAAEIVRAIAQWRDLLCASDHAAQGAPDAFDACLAMTRELSQQIEESCSDMNLDEEQRLLFMLRTGMAIGMLVQARRTDLQEVG